MEFILGILVKNREDKGLAQFDELHSIKHMGNSWIVLIIKNCL
ncbi:hypothetical protein STZ1_20323 [Bacillus subtilis]